MMMTRAHALIAVALTALPLACSTPAKPTASSAEAPEATPAEDAPGAAPPTGHPIVDAADRDPADRALDSGRKPAELLDFIGVQPGMRVAELFAGGGYTAELLARAVGETGTVYAQNSKVVLERFAEKPWSERLKKPVMKNVVRVDRELTDPLPPEAKDLDRVVFVLSYHDAVHLGADRAKMNRAIFDALKVGGTYVIADHAARPGSGVADAQTLHRIEEDVVIQEVLAAGFVPGGSASFLRNPSDPRDWNASPMAAGDKRGESDRFVLEFKKPERKKAVNAADR